MNSDSELSVESRLSSLRTIPGKWIPPIGSVNAIHRLRQMNQRFVSVTTLLKLRAPRLVRLRCERSRLAQQHLRRPRSSSPRYIRLLSIYYNNYIQVERFDARLYDLLNHLEFINTEPRCCASSRTQSETLSIIISRIPTGTNIIAIMTAYCCDFPHPLHSRYSTKVRTLSPHLDTIHTGWYLLLVT